MSLTSFFVEFSTAPLTLDAIILLKGLSWHTWFEIFRTEGSLRLVINFCISHHGLSKCHRLLFPFGYFLSRFWFLFNWLSFISASKIRFWRLIRILNLFYLITFPLFLGIKDFSFLLENFLTNFSMLFISSRSKFTSTGRAFNPITTILRSSILIIRNSSRWLLESLRRQLRRLCPSHVIFWRSMLHSSSLLGIERISFIHGHFTSRLLVVRRSVFRFLLIFTCVISSSIVILSRLKLISSWRSSGHTGVGSQIFLSLIVSR